MGRLQNIILLIFLATSATALASKKVFYSDGNITIYADNTVIQTGTDTAPVFKSSSTWVEEDFFTQQEKYCEVDSTYVDRLKKSISNKSN
mgnify:CR=1 FL=1